MYRSNISFFRFSDKKYPDMNENSSRTGITLPGKNKISLKPIEKIFL
jgi:hypothetical protein